MRGRLKIAVLAVGVATSAAACGTRVERNERTAVGSAALPASTTGAAAANHDATAPSAAAESTPSPSKQTLGPAGQVTPLAPRPSAVTAAPADRADTPKGDSPRFTPRAASASNGDPNAGPPTLPSPVPGSPADGGDPIAIGSVGVLSGPIGTNLKPISETVRVWVRWVNDRGGLNGHKVAFYQADTAGDPARHRAIVQQMVDEKKVVAFVGQPGDAFGGQGSVEYLTQRGVPVIGSEGAAQWFYESPVYFPQIMHGRPLIQALAVGVADAARARQKTKLGLWTCVEAQMCRDMENGIPATTTPRGLQVVHRSKISIGQPDFTAECLSARNAGAELIFAAADGATVSRAATSCARQGYRPIWMLAGQQVLSQQHAADPNFDGAISIDTQAPWFLDNTPGRKEFRDVMARYAPNMTLTTSNMVGWISARLFELAARQAPQPLTRAGLLGALASISGDPLADLTVPYRFGAGRPAAPTTCYWLESPQDGKWTSPDGGARHCFEYDTRT